MKNDLHKTINYVFLITPIELSSHFQFCSLSKYFYDITCATKDY